MKFKMIHENYNVADLDKSIAFYEKFAGDEDETDEDDYRTVENALWILDAMKLTDVQKRRFMAKHIDGMSLREIAEKEQAHFMAVQESLQAAEKKRKKIISKNFSEKA